MQKTGRDALSENKRLSDTLAFVKTETVSAIKKEADTRAEYEHEFRSADGRYSVDLVVAELMHRGAAQRLLNLRMAAVKPYFTRIDFIPSGGKEETWYIGKYGVSDEETFEPVIVDWRSPVANLYYSGQLGPMEYSAPDGDIKGELTLKRIFYISDGVIKSMFDTDIVSESEYLHEALNYLAEDKLRDIVTTIQREQNDIIRAPRDKTIVVQGVAGSGKTSIALHRIAYLLYTFREKLAPENMLILAPNPLFLDYISAVLPELGVENIKQTTFEMLCAKLLGKGMPRLNADDKLARLIDDKVPEDEKAVIRLSGRIKGSFDYKKAIDKYIAGLESRIVPKSNIVFGPLRLFEYPKIAGLFLKDLKPHSFRTRIKLIRGYIEPELKRAAAVLSARLRKECDKRVGQVKLMQLSDKERSAMLKKIYDTRDERIKTVQERAKQYLESYMSKWPALDLLDCYGEFLRELPDYGILDRANAEAVRDSSIAMLDKRRVEKEDLPALVYLCKAISGLEGNINVLHVVIDEAQDFSPIQFMLLREFAGHGSFTIVGDLAQGIHSYRSITSWPETMDRLFSDTVYLPLQTSYRNTVEIMEFAQKVSSKFPRPGQLAAKPVLRHGLQPEIKSHRNMKEAAYEIVREIEAFRAQGFSTIAVIDKTPAQCSTLYKLLSEKTDGVKLLHEADEKYTGGVSVIPATAVKGLEFDAVIIADVSENRYRFDILDAGILYVCMTRPLHRLICHSVGPVTALMG